MRFQFSLRQLLVQTLLFSIIGAYLVMLRYDPRALAASFSAFAVFALLVSAKKSDHQDDRSWPLAMYYSFALAVTAATAFGAELWLAGEKPPARNGTELLDAFVDAFAKVTWFAIVFAGCGLICLACLARRLLGAGTRKRWWCK